MRYLLVLVAILAGFFIACRSTYAQDEALEWRIEHVAGLKAPEVRSLLANLKKQVASRNARATCALVIYALRTPPESIGTKIACEAQFDRVFNKRVTDAIASQHFEDLFVNWQGVMIGRGEVWISGVCKDKTCKRHEFGIVTVNN